MILKNIGWLLAFCLVGCHANRQVCKKFYTYKSNTINVKGISLNLKKAGVEFGGLNVAEISIDPKNVVATEKLQKLDLIQFTMCNQIESLSATDSLKAAVRIKYINTLLEMLTISNKPDSTF